MSKARITQQRQKSLRHAADIAKIYESGKGSIKMRATYTRRKWRYYHYTRFRTRYPAVKYLEQIAQQMQAKETADDHRFT